MCASAEIRRCGSMRSKFDGLAKGQASPGLARRDGGGVGGDCARRCARRCRWRRRTSARSPRRRSRASGRSSLCRGVKTGQIVRPLGSVGCYVPGGRYPLPSTLLMTVTPAQVAGVARIVVCSPKPARETLAAAWLAGVTEFYRVGGAQAIAALALGTKTIARVDKIVGPGNLYVTAAKVVLSSECGIDMPAGPTEIVVTSETGDPAGIAADLVAQAEHDPEALAVLITSNARLASAVRDEVKRQSKGNAIAKRSLAAQGSIFVTEDVAEAQTLTNRLAPEHLTVDTTADLDVGEKCRLGVCGRRMRRSRWATTSPAQTMCCRRAVWAACAAV